jgi:hypothetical protein
LGYHGKSGKNIFRIHFAWKYSRKFGGGKQRIAHVDFKEKGGKHEFNRCNPEDLIRLPGKEKRYQAKPQHSFLPGHFLFYLIFSQWLEKSSQKYP